MAAVAVVATRWPFRSHALFSWDSANFALGMARIDIAAHRPHPPGYLGYVIAGRLLDGLTGDANAALVAWNVIVTVLAAAVLIAWAGELADDASRTFLPLATAIIFITGPLLWFYGEVAEIYPSELLVSLLVAYTAWRSLRGHASSLVWCAASLAAAAVFKVTAAILIVPLAAYAWWRAPPLDRRRAAMTGGVLFAIAAGIFLTLQPDLPAVIWTQFASATAGTRVVGGTTGALRALNINARDTFTAALSALGVVNLVVLAIWLVADRRLPAGLSRPVAALWAVPWLILVLAIHIGRRGYILPLVPLAVLVIAGWYSRQRRSIAIGLVVLQLMVNVAQFAWLKPAEAPDVTTLYRNKSIAARVMSDLEAVRYPTAITIARSDRRAANLAEFVRARCPSGDPVIVADADWRRILWYFPEATAIHASGRTVLFSGHQTDATAIPPAGITLTTSCPVIWVADEEGRAPDLMPADAATVPGVGWTTGVGAITVTPTSISGSATAGGR